MQKAPKKNERGQIVYELTEADICYILNDIMDEHITLFPFFNKRFNTQQSFMEKLHKLKHLCPSCYKKLNIIGECNECS